MQRANILLSLSGDVGNTIPKFNVTAAEIAVLRALHGPESVSDVERVEDSDVSDRDEIARLKDVYGGALDGNANRIIDRVYPGVGAKAVTSIGELGLPDTSFKVTSRTSADDKPKKAIDHPEQFSTGKAPSKAEEVGGPSNIMA